MLAASLPVDDERNGGRWRFVRRRDQKPLSVWSHNVLLPRNRSSRRNARLKARHRSASIGRTTSEGDWYRHQAFVRGDVEQLFPVASPANLGAAVGGDAHFGARAWKRLDINLWRS